MFIRRTPFGVPFGTPSPSAMTTRLIPLTNGVKLSQPWPALAPGSSVSMTNFFPLDGKLVARSRLSSVNSVRVNTDDVKLSLTYLPSAAGQSPALWMSSDTEHYVLSSTGSISLASYVSSFGIGVTGLASQGQWRYAVTYSATLDENMLLAVGSSFDTILCLYTDPINSQPRYSYLTSAPKTVAVGVFDNYVVAFNVQGDANSVTRVQWCQRGSPSNWTGEGSGYEDLLSARGVGSAVRDLGDGRMILFTDVETWYATSAAYPAQFVFNPLDRAIGCPWPSTIQETSEGLIFLGSDFRLRLLPRGGGLSRVICPDVAPLIRERVIHDLDPAGNFTWGVFDPRRRLYILTMCVAAGPTGLPIVINIDTEEWGYLNFPSNPRAGVAVPDARNLLLNTEGLFFLGQSGQTVYSTASMGPEDGSKVTAIWRSGVLAADLPASYKQVTELAFDYRSESSSTLTVTISGNGGLTMGSGTVVALPGDATNNVVGPQAMRRAVAQVYDGGKAPVLEIRSTSTCFELHRIDATLSLQGRTQ